MAASDSTTLLASVAGTWQLDPSSTTIEIHTKAMWGLAKVKGSFAAVSGSGVVGEDGALSGELVVDASSVDTKNKKRDEHLRSDEFFGASTFPTFTFTASELVAASDGTFKIKGSLLIKDQSRPVELAATTTRLSPARLALKAETTIDRSQWGISWAKLGAGLINRVVVAAEFDRS
jgi:polyisoprenoid-binding protein YceI